MDPRLAPIVGQATVAASVFTRALDGVDRAALLRRPGPSSNPMLWVAGHLTQFRCRTARALGSDRPVPWESLFATGSDLQPDDAYPPVDAVLTIWDEVSAEIHDRLTQLSAAALDAPPAVRTPSTDGTLLGSLALFAFHEGYHIGQLGYLRKWLGYSRIFEP